MPTPLSHKAKKVLFLLLHTPWFAIYQRPHHFAKWFKSQGYLVTVVTTEKLSSCIRRWLASGDAYRSHTESAHKIFAIPSLDIFGTRWTWNKLIHPFIHGLVVKNLIKKGDLVWMHGVPKYELGVHLTRIQDGKIIMDICDDFSAFGDQVDKKRLAMERIFARKAKIVLTVTRPLRDRLGSYGSNAQIIPNGVDSKFIDAAELQNAPFKSDDNRPIVGYHGYIASWLDFDLIDEVAGALPECNFVFVGPVDDSVKVQFSRIQKHHNVIFMGMRAYHLMPHFVKSFDVGIIPWKVNRLTLAADPIKLYEYLGCGVPVVATSLPQLSGLGEGIVETANNCAEFVEKIVKMIKLKDNGRLRSKRIELARSNTWESRFRHLAGIMEAANCG